jgi:hypothetical protein
MCEDDLQGYSNFRKCIEAKEKLAVVLRHLLVIVARMNIEYICTMLYAVQILCNLKGDCTRKSNSYTKVADGYSNPITSLDRP